MAINKTTDSFFNENDLLGNKPVLLKYGQSLNAGDIVSIDYDKESKELKAKKLFGNLGSNVPDLQLTSDSVNEAIIVNIDNQFGVLFYKTGSNKALAIPFKVSDSGEVVTGSSVEVCSQCSGYLNGSPVGQSSVIVGFSYSTTLYVAALYLDKSSLSLHTSSVVSAYSSVSVNNRPQIVATKDGKAQIWFTTSSGLYNNNITINNINSSSISISTSSYTTVISGDPGYCAFAPVPENLAKGKGIIGHIVAGVTASTYDINIYSLYTSPSMSAISYITNSYHYSRFKELQTSHDIQDAVVLGNNLIFSLTSNSYIVPLSDALIPDGNPSSISIFDLNKFRMEAVFAETKNNLLTVFDKYYKGLCIYKYDPESSEFVKLFSDDNCIGVEDVFISNSHIYTLTKTYDNAYILSRRFKINKLTIPKDVDAISVSEDLKKPIYSQTEYLTSTIQYSNVAKLDSNVVIEAFAYTGSTYGYVRLGSIDANNNIVWSQNTFQFTSAITQTNSSAIGRNIKVVPTSSSSGVIIYGYSGNLRAIVFNVSGDSVSFGSEAILSGYYNTSTLSIDAVEIDTDKLVISTSNSSGYPSVVVLTKSGDTLTFGTPVVVNSNSGYASVAKLDVNKFLVAYSYGSSVYCAVGSVSGSDITLETAVYVFSSGVSVNVEEIDTDKAVIYSHGHAVVASVSGVTVSLGSELNISNMWHFQTASNFFDIELTKVSSTRVAFLYGNDHRHYLGVLDVSGTDLSVYEHGPVLDTYSIAGVTYYRTGFLVCLDAEHLLAGIPIGNACRIFYGVYKLDGTSHFYFAPTTTMSEFKIAEVDANKYIVGYRSSTTLYLGILEKTSYGYVYYGQTTISSVNALLKIDKIEQNKAIIAYRNTSSYTYVRVVTLSGQTLSVGYESQVSTNSLSSISFTAMSSSVIVMHSYDAGKYTPYRLIVNGATISSISAGNYINSYTYQTFKLSDTRFITFSVYSSYLYCKIYTVTESVFNSQSTITVDSSYCYGSYDSFFGLHTTDDKYIFHNIYYTNNIYYYKTLIISIDVDGNSVISKSVKMTPMPNTVTTALYNSNYFETKELADNFSLAVYDKIALFMKYDPASEEFTYYQVFYIDPYQNRLIIIDDKIILSGYNVPNTMLCVAMQSAQSDVAVNLDAASAQLNLTLSSSASYIKGVKLIHLRDNKFAIAYINSYNSYLYCSFITYDDVSGYFTVDATYAVSSNAASNFDVVKANHSSIVFSYFYSNSVYTVALTTGGQLGAALSTAGDYNDVYMLPAGFNEVLLLYMSSSTAIGYMIFRVDGSILTTKSSNSTHITGTLMGAMNISEGLGVIFYNASGIIKTRHVTLSSMAQVSDQNLSGSFPTNLAKFYDGYTTASKDVLIMTAVNSNNVLYLCAYDIKSASVVDYIVVDAVKSISGAYKNYKAYNLLSLSNGQMFLAYSTNSTYVKTYLLSIECVDQKLKILSSYQVLTGETISLASYIKDDGDEMVAFVEGCGLQRSSIRGALLTPLPLWKPLGIAQENGSAGEYKLIATPGTFSSVHTGLIPKKIYYIDRTTGELTPESSNGVKFGVAYSPAILKLFEEE